MKQQIKKGKTKMVRNKNMKRFLNNKFSKSLLSFISTMSEDMKTMSIVELTIAQADTMLTPEHDTSFNTKLDDFIADYPNA